MELKANPSKILMSESLRGQIPDVEDGGDPIDQLSGQAVFAIVDRRIGGQAFPVSGLLRSVLFDSEPELEISIELHEALATVKAQSVLIGGFELHHGETTVEVPGPFEIKAARIQEIDVPRQLCVIAMQLQRVKKG